MGETGRWIALPLVLLTTACCPSDARDRHPHGARRPAGHGAAQILREGLLTTLGGAAPGFQLALGLGRVFSSMLHQVGSTDPATFPLAPAVLAACALLACWLLARRVMRVDPIVALKCE